MLRKEHRPRVREHNNEKKIDRSLQHTEIRKIFRHRKKWKGKIVWKDYSRSMIEA
jgi:hypothetical protein